MSLPRIIRDSFGLYVPAADLHLDARRAPGLVFVSHAHSDHCSGARHIICTRETAELHRRLRGVKQVTTLSYGDALPLRDATLELTPAGHTLGSAMAVIRSAEGTLVYTGDYKLRAGAFSTGVTVPHCDTLVMECTFGDSRYRFPPEPEVLGRLFDFIDETLAAGDVPVILAYAFGKTQEALHHLTARGYDVGVYDPAAGLCQAHTELGYNFPGPGSWSRCARGTADAQVLIMTSRGRDALPGSSRRYRFVHLTGWACGRSSWRFPATDFALPLSGHADFDELVRTARESGARQIYTVHGSPRFAAYLRNIGLNARHLDARANRSPVNGRAAVTTPMVSPASPAQLTLELA